LRTEDEDWRDHTIILLDNAGPHKSGKNVERYKAFSIPIMFLGPYHFKLAPIELMFSFLKERNLNPLFSRVHSEYYY